MVPNIFCQLLSSNEIDKKCFLLYLIAFADVLSSQRDGLYGMVVEYENFRIVGSIMQWNILTVGRENMNYLIAFYFKWKKYDSKLNNVPAQMHRQKSKSRVVGWG